MNEPNARVVGLRLWSRVMYDVVPFVESMTGRSPPFGFLFGGGYLMLVKCSFVCVVVVRVNAVVPPSARHVASSNTMITLVFVVSMCL